MQRIAIDAPSPSLIFAIKWIHSVGFSSTSHGFGSHPFFSCILYNNMADSSEVFFTEKFDHTLIEAQKKPFMSTVHQEITTLGWAPFRLSDKSYDSKAYAGPLYVVVCSDRIFPLHVTGLFRCRGRNDFVLMDFHIQPTQALTVRAYQEDSRHAVPSFRQYVPLQLHVKIDRFKFDSERTSLCIRYGQDETCIALRAGALRKLSTWCEDISSVLGLQENRRSCSN